MHGRVTLTLKEFVRGWTNGGENGPLLLLEASHEFGSSARGAFADLRFFWRYVRGHSLLLAQILASIAVSTGFQLLFAFLTRSLVDVGIASRSMSFVYIILASQLVIFAARASNDFLRGWVMLHVTTRANLSILADFLKRLTRVSMAYLEGKPIGDILQRIGDHGRVQSFLTSTVISVVGAVGNLIVFSVALAMLSPRITLIFLAAASMLAFWIAAFAKRRRHLDQERFQQSAVTQTSLIQLIAGMRDIRLATCEREKRVEWEQLQAKQFRLSVVGLALVQRLQGGAMAINELKTVFVSCAAATEVINGQMSLGTMLAISYLVGSLSGPVDQLVNLFQSAQDARISVERIAEVHSSVDDPCDTSGALAVPCRLDIAIDSMSFRYTNSGTNVLKNITLDLPQGIRVAIVGPSGSGKSTLVKLLLRLYEPNCGAITVGGASLADINVAEWRQRCGVVMQDGYVFSDTLCRNIGLGFDTFDWSRLREVCRIARLNDLLGRLPEGFQTRIGPNGHDLSAGERQRVLIARALYKDPDLFIFDEATSALDGANEREILLNLGSALSGKTVITVAHRLSTVINADRIFVLQDGLLTEHGTHIELVSSRQTYYDLIRNQLELGA